MPYGRARNYHVMKRIIIVHQWMAGAEGDWRPWLRSELKKQGHEVIVPEMPDIDTPIIERWVNHLASIAGIPDKNTYFIGHSIGCQAILRYLETIQSPVGGAIFVAGWFDLTHVENDEVRAIAEPWIKTPINFEKIANVLPKSVAILSDNDIYVSFNNASAIFEKQLHSKVIILHNAGHITAEDGFTTLPEIINQLNLLTQIS